MDATAGEFMRQPFHLLLLFSSVAAAADPAPPVLRTGTNAGKELNEAQRMIVAGQATEGVDKLRKLLDESGAELVTLDGSHYVPLHRAAHGVLLALPPAELQAYRERINGPAARLLATGKAELDPRPLLKIVERYFASSSTEEALLLLADLSFARGDYRSAETHLRRLLPQAAGGEVALPTVKTKQAEVQAGILLAALFDGDKERVGTELPIFRKAFPQAAGRLDHTTGNLADILQRRLDLGPAESIPAPKLGDWLTLGGDAARSGRAECRLPRFWSARPTWDRPFAIDPVARAMPAGRPANARAAAMHPVVWEGIVYGADAGSVVGFEASSGMRRFQYDLREAMNDTDLPEEKTTGIDADFPLTVAENRLFARLGSTAIPRQSVEGKAGTPCSWIVAFGKTRGANNDPPLTRLWSLAPPVPEGINAAWEAAPVVHRGRLYAAFTMEAKSGLVQAIACYPVSNAHPGKPYWIAEVADLPPSLSAEVRRRPEPLAVAGENIVLCTHAGAVVAVDSASGKPAWGFTYAKPAKPSTVYRDVNPPVAVGGRVFVAPTDTDKLFALDAVTGAKLWQVEGIQIDQLLGVAAGKIIAAIAAPQRGLRGFDVVTGSDREPRGWAIHDDPWLASYGRGLVTDDAVLWPTKSGVFFVRPSDGMPLPARLPGPQGNLALADGVLIVGTADGVRAFGPAKPKGDEVKETAQSRAERTRSLAVAALKCPPTASGYENFTKLFPEVEVRKDDFVLNRDGIPTKLKHVLAAHFGLPFDAAPTKEDDRSELAEATTPLRYGEVPLPNPRCIPLPTTGTPLPGYLPAIDGDSLHLVRLGSEKVVWSAPLPSSTAFTQYVVHERALYLVGPNAVAKYRSASGERAWVAEWPDTPPPDVVAIEMDGTAGAEAEFRNPKVVGKRLILKRGAYLVAVDTETGEFVWINRPTGPWTTRSHATRFGEPLGDGAPRWADAYYADASVLLAHDGAEGVRALDTVTGAVLGKLRSSVVPWTTAPVSLEPNVVALPSGPGFDYGLVSLVELGGKRREPTERRRKQTAGETSLTGAPPILVAGPNAAMVFTVRNIGLEVSLMKSTNGTDDPRRGTLIPARTIDPAACVSDGERVYVPAAGKLWSFRWADGLTAFAPVVLDGRNSEFTTHRVGSSLVCIGMRAKGEPARITGLQPLHGFAAYDAAVNGTVPLIVLDAASGAIISKREVPVTGAHVNHVGGNFIAVASVGRSVLVKLQD